MAGIVGSAVRLTVSVLLWLFLPEGARAAAAAVGALADPDQAALLSSVSLLQHSHQALHGRNGAGGVAAAAASAEGGARRRWEVPKATINLDLPPEQRWYDFYAAHRELFLSLEEEFTHLKLKGLDPSRDFEEQRQEFFADIDFAPDEELLKEHEGIVRAVNDSRVNLSTVLWTEIAYERAVSQGCTAVLAAQQDGSVLHGRNLDLADGQDLIPALVDVTFTRGGKILGEAINFMGAVGLHTLYRTGGYSLVQNTRNGCSDLQANRAAARMGGRPFMFMMRHVLEDIAGFESAVHYVASVPLMAPQYFTLSGPGAFEGALITRDRTGSLPPYPNVLMLSSQIDRWYIVQTNDDVTAEPDDSRRPTVLASLQDMQPTEVSEDSVLRLMVTEPVRNGGTVFSWVLDVGRGTSRLLAANESFAQQPARFGTWLAAAAAP